MHIHHLGVFFLTWKCALKEENIRFAACRSHKGGDVGEERQSQKGIIKAEKTEM